MVSDLDVVADQEREAFGETHTRHERAFRVLADSCLLCVRRSASATRLLEVDSEGLRKLWEMRYETRDDSWSLADVRAVNTLRWAVLLVRKAAP